MKLFDLQNSFLHNLGQVEYDPKDSFVEFSIQEYLEKIHFPIILYTDDGMFVNTQYHSVFSSTLNQEKPDSEKTDEFIMSHFMSASGDFINLHIFQEKKILFQFKTLEYSGRWFEVLNKRLGGLTLLVIHEVTFLVEELENIKATKFRLLKYFNTAKNAVCIFEDSSPSFPLLAVNQSLMDLFELKTDLLTTNEFYSYLPETFTNLLKEKLDHLQTGSFETHFETELIIGGESKTLSVELKKTADINSKNDTIICSIIDITSHKNTEAELQKSQGKAEISNNLKSSFLSNISHEIRTPLNGIMGFTEILREEIREPQQHTFIDRIFSSAERLLSTLNSIIDLSRLEAENLMPAKNNTDINQLLDKLLHKYQVYAESKNLKFTSELIGYPLYVSTDAELFKHIIDNLIDNAVKFTNSGSIGLSLEYDENYVYIKVKDTGIGIAEENIEMVFEEFRQVSEGISRTSEGMGLGLTLARKMLRLMKGEIFVESELHIGSTFIIKYPLLHQMPAVIQPIDGVNRSIKTDKSIPTRRTVLLVEDNEINRELVFHFLSKEFDLEFAVDGDEALEMIIKNAYDIILMDINLGTKLNGINLYTEVKNSNFNKETPVIAVTGYTMPGDKEKILSHGFRGYISKPFTKKDLYSAIIAVYK